MRGPARLASVPEGMKGHTCSPKIDSTPSKAPEHTPDVQLQGCLQCVQGGIYAQDHNDVKLTTMRQSKFFKKVRMLAMLRLPQRTPVSYVE